uniref:DUF7082 domain-containing protein n=1 Tax=Kwoniella dejecticola CBS 10117 TaxID=1296121 RepID=A0A1A6A753_9TREE|nr:uncharacterized protein I303_03601 [Kwoniella dejecticola CBS 10117]OBR85887.1 hypothetical protein I303_03601 [Kwoniella dejecticola CBS 10117]
MYHTSSAAHYNPAVQPRYYQPPTPISATSIPPSIRAPYIPRTTAMDPFGMPPSPSSPYSSHEPNPGPSASTSTPSYQNPGSSFLPSRSYMSSPHISQQFDNLTTSTPGLLPQAGNERPVTVYEWGPREGVQGNQIMIKADVNLPSTTPPANPDGSSPHPSPHSKPTKALRVVFGTHPVQTAVTTLESSGGSQDGQYYQLVATAPSYSSTGAGSQGYGNKVNVSVQVLAGDFAIVETVPLGEFSYTNTGSRSNPLKRGGENLESSRPSPHQVHRRVISTNSAAYTTPELQQYATMPSTYHPSPSGRCDPYASTSNAMPPVSHSAPPPYTPGSIQPSLMRSTQLGPGIPAPTPYVNSGQKACLEMSGDLMTMSKGWTQEEWHARRRLVQFWRRQEGTTIHAAFKPISQAEYPAYQQSIIVSCIFREDKNICYVTSVDAIYLLEALVGTRFTVEEKNRIRRNLEGFRPITISKSKPGNEDFFRLIMNFPNPRPRNIEKDVKVFPWEILSQALKKIIGKYSASFPYPASPMAPPPLPSQSYQPANYGIPGPLQPLLPSNTPEEGYVKQDPYGSSLSLNSTGGSGAPNSGGSLPHLTSHGSSDSSSYGHSTYANPHTPSQHPNSPTAYRTSNTPHAQDEKANNYLNLSPPYGGPGNQWINQGDPNEGSNPSSGSYVIPSNLVYPDQPHQLPHVHQNVSRQPNPNDLRINYPGMNS